MNEVGTRAQVSDKKLYVEKEDGGEKIRDANEIGWLLVHGELSFP